LTAGATLMQEGKHSLFTFRLFHGITASAWGRLLAQHRYAISPSRLPLVLQISAMSVVNSTLGSIQNLVFSRSYRGLDDRRASDLHPRPLPHRHHLSP